MKALTTVLMTTALALSAVPARAFADAPAISRPAKSIAPVGDPGSRTRGTAATAAPIYPWWDGAVYHLATAPERVSDIVLQASETLISVAAGDTARWVIGDTTSGSGATRRIHILVKPAAPGLRTNLVITTDRRVYRLELASGARAMTSIAWTYPQDELIALGKQQAALTAAEPVAAPVAVERLNFNYSIDGHAPAWRPIRAFDDGAQVFIEFPPAIDSTEAPPLFVIGASGMIELVNYRKRGRYYVVDRLFDAAELRLGGKRQQIVRITREGARQRKRSGRPS